MQTNGGLSSLVQGHVTPSQSPFGSPASSTSIPSSSSPRLNSNIRPEFDDRLVGNFPIKQESLPNLQGKDLSSISGIQGHTRCTGPRFKNSGDKILNSSKLK